MPQQASAGGAANTALMDLLLQHGADVNAQVTGTKTYSMRISRAPSANEGMTALHVAAQAGRADLVRYLLEKGANPRRSPMATAARRSIWSAAVDAAAAHQASLRLLPLPRRERLLLLQNGPGPVQAAAARQVEAQTRQVQPRFALFCRTRPPRNKANRSPQIGDQRHQCKRARDAWIGIPRS